MIKTLSLKNFKAFKSLDDLDIRNITVIAGKNSCGKSSIIQSLLLLKQTLKSRSKHPLCLDGDYLKHTNLKDISNGIPAINRASIGYKFTLNGKGDSTIDLSFINKETAQSLSNKTLGKKRNISYAPAIDHKNSTDIFDGKNGKELLLKKLEKIGFPIAKLRYVSHEVKYKKFSPDSIEITFIDENGNTVPIPLPISLMQDSIFHDFQKLNNTLLNIKYLSPIRAIPERAYVHYSEDVDELKEDGSNAAHLLWALADKDVLWKNKKIPLSSAVNEALKCMGLEQEISPDKIGDILYKVGISEKQSGSQVSLADVGFGYSQVIPVILMGLINKPSNLMLIEQPEIHLHPSSSANLADLFINFANNDKRFIIETHSQEFINRLRLRVIENPELKDKINIVFVEGNSELGTTAKQFEIDENGMFPSWPDGFLDESEKLAQAILNARVKKSQENNSFTNNTFSWDDI
ncbi:conserved hypothetical protein [Vibrio chagasii]|nr:conserved hypothetical protein [Vibrio chagasii]